MSSLLKYLQDLNVALILHAAVLKYVASSYYNLTAHSVFLVNKIEY
jgi:hypothetical protein